MKHGDASRQLAKLVQVRDLQRLRAQSEAMAASKEARAKRAAREESEAAREASLESWRACMAEPSVAPEIAVLWRGEVGRRSAEAVAATREADAAELERAHRAAAYDAAALRHDTIKDLARDAWKKDARKSDDTALEDALDLHAARKRSLR
jgi:hypothetical protein